MTVSFDMLRKLISIPKDKMEKIKNAAKYDNRSVSNHFVHLALKDIEEKESRGINLDN